MRRILAAIDLDQPDNPAFARACAIAAENCADLAILQLQGAKERAPGTDRRTGLMAMIAAARDRHPCIGTITASTVRCNAHALATAAEAANADLLVMRNTISMTVPHDAPFVLIDHVLHRASLPVLAVQNAAEAPYRRLVALVDRGAAARQTLDLALRVKSAREIYVVHACGGREAPDDGAAALEQLVATTSIGRPDVSVAIRPIVSSDDISTAVVRTWQEYQPDLVVAVPRRRRGIRRLFGSSHVRELLEDTPFDLLAQEAGSFAAA